MLKATTHSVKFVTTLLCISVLAACGSDNKRKSPSTPPPIVSTPAPTPSPAPSPTPVEQTFDYQALISEAVKTDIPGIVLQVQGPDVDFLGSAGLADIERHEAMPIHAQMPAGSAGKKATALLVATLHDQGLLDIDNTIDHWLPASLLEQIEYSETMTLRQLLSHTSGVYDYLDDDSVDDWFDSAFNDTETLKTDVYALQFALNKPAYFPPGESFKYSNTGYLLAGLILDQVLGEHHHKAMRSYVLEPLSMNDTFYSGVEKDKGNLISGYTLLDDHRLNSKPFYNNVGVADAPLVSTVSDLTKLLKAIVTDKSVINDNIRHMLIGDSNLFDLGNQVYYGMGVMKDIVNGYTIYHHGGEEVGYKTANLYVEEKDTSITLFFNCHGYDACNRKTDEVVQLVLLETIKQPE